MKTPDKAISPIAAVCAAVSFSRTYSHVLEILIWICELACDILRSWTRGRAVGEDVGCRVHSIVGSRFAFPAQANQASRPFGTVNC